MELISKETTNSLLRYAVSVAVRPNYAIHLLLVIKQKFLKN